MPTVCLAGTGGMLPLPERFLTTLYVRSGANALLIDCGEGTQVALAQAELKLSRINIIFITHAHADHVTGLPGLLLSLGNTNRSEPVTICYPAPAEQAIRGLLTVCGELPYQLILRPLPADQAISFPCPEADPFLTVSTLPLQHSVPCIGYRLSFGKRPRFLPEKARALAVPVTDYKALIDGRSITLPSGVTVLPEDVTAPPPSPTVITYVTDTLPLPEIADFGRDSELFICEGMYGSDDKREAMEQKKHTTMPDACRLAAKAGAKRLWLTHYSPAERTPEEYEDSLKALFPSLTIARNTSPLTYSF